MSFSRTFPFFLSPCFFSSSSLFVVLFSFCSFFFTISSFFPLVLSQNYVVFPSTFMSQYSATVSATFPIYNYTTSYTEYYMKSSINNQLIENVLTRGRYESPSTWTYWQDLPSPGSFYTFDSVNLQTFQLGSCDNYIDYVGQSSHIMAHLPSVYALTQYIYGYYTLWKLNSWVKTSNNLLAERNMIVDTYTSTMIISISADNSLQCRYFQNLSMCANSASVYFIKTYNLKELIDFTYAYDLAHQTTYAINITQIKVHVLSSSSSISSSTLQGIVPVRVEIWWVKNDTLTGTISNLYNVIDWSNISPYNPPATLPYAGTCAIIQNEFYTPNPLPFTSAAAYSSPSPTLTLSSFPSQSISTIESPYPNSPPMNNTFAPYSYSLNTIRQNTPLPDGTSYTTNNEIISYYNWSTSLSEWYWYQYNHTLNGGGGGWFIQLPALQQNPIGSPYTCQFQYLDSTFRSPLDSIHEAGIAKLFAMADATHYIPNYQYAGTTWIRGIPADTYSYTTTVQALSDGSVYSFTQSIYTFPRYWQLQGKPTQSLNIVGIYDVGLNTATNAAYTDRYHIFNTFAVGDPFLNTLPGYNCPSFPNNAATSTSQFNLDWIAPAYSATVTVHTNPYSYSFNEYYGPALDGQPLGIASSYFYRVDGRYGSPDTSEVMYSQYANNLFSVSNYQLTSGTQDMSGFGYSTRADYYTHMYNPSYTQPCKVLSLTGTSNVLISNQYMAPTIPYWTNKLAGLVDSSTYVGTFGNEQVWTVSSIKSEYVENGEPVILLESGTFVFTTFTQGSNSKILPLSIDFSLTTITTTNSSQISVTTNYSLSFTNLNISTPQAPTFASAIPACVNDNMVSRYGQLGNDPLPSTNAPIDTISSLNLPAGKSFSIVMIMQLFLYQGNLNNYTVQWHVQTNGLYTADRSNVMRERVEWALTDSSLPNYATDRGSYIFIYGATPATYVFSIPPYTGSTNALPVYCNYSNGATNPILSVSTGTFASLFSTQLSSLNLQPQSVAVQQSVLTSVFTQPLTGIQRTLSFLHSGVVVPGRVNANQSLFSLTDVSSQGSLTVSVLQYQTASPSIGIFSPILTASQSPLQVNGQCIGIPLPPTTPEFFGSSSSGLGEGGRIAIGIVFGLIVPCLIFACLIYWCYYRGQGERKTFSSPSMVNEDDDTTVLDTASHRKTVTVHDDGAESPAEVASENIDSSIEFRSLSRLSHHSTSHAKRMEEGDLEMMKVDKGGSSHAYALPMNGTSKRKEFDEEKHMDE